MAVRRTDPILEQLRRTVLCHDRTAGTDGQLLDRFIAEREEAAFEALVRRHGPMVFAVCRRLLSNPDDAEDAFQATFLVLARKARSVSPRELVGNWLYGVARITALRARAANARRQRRERQVSDMPEPAQAEDRFLESLLAQLDQELSRLPDKYRAALVLCDLEGLSRRDAARQLQIPEGTLSSRLTTARKMLARRLARQGLAVSAGALPALLARKTASAGVPAALASSLARSASLFAAGQAAGVVPAAVAALMEGVLKTMLLTKLKVLTASLLVVSLLVLGAGQFPSPGARAEQGKATAEKRGTDGAGKDQATETDSQVWLEVPQDQYSALFERAVAVVIEHFEIAYTNRYEGRIETAPAITRKKQGSELAIQRRGVLLVQAADAGGYMVQVRVLREVEIRLAVGLPSPPQSVDSWQPIGRDRDLERAILRRLTTEVEKKMEGQPQAKAEGQAKAEVRLWAALSVPQPAFRQGELTQATPGPGKSPFQVNFVLVNDGDKTVNPELGSSKLFINGKDLEDWGFIIANGPKDKRWQLLPARDDLSFGYALGKYFEKPGIYRVVWKGKQFQSAELVFRVLPRVSE